MEGVCFDTADGGSLARCLSSWQGRDAPGKRGSGTVYVLSQLEETRLCLLPLAGSNTPIHHGTAPAPGHQPVFWSHFSPPTRGRCSNTSGTCWRLGNNELLAKEEQQCGFSVNYTDPHKVCFAPLLCCKCWCKCRCKNPDQTEHGRQSLSSSSLVQKETIR